MEITRLFGIKGEFKESVSLLECLSCVLSLTISCRSLRGSGEDGAQQHGLLRFGCGSPERDFLSR